MRRHACALDRGDRLLRDHERVVGRLRRPPDRGGHRRGRLQLLRARAAEADELRAELERVKREAKQRKQAAPADDAVGPLVAGAKDAGGVSVVTAQLDGMDADALLELSDRVKQKAAPAAVVLGSLEDGRVHLIANFDKPRSRSVDSTR